MPIFPEQEVLLKSWLKHRGPDQQQSANCGSMNFYHCRLSIQDAIGGGQPMQRGPLTIVFNGEIYNHLELRQQFSLQCQQRSDTETILALYEKLGTNMFMHIDGMFALAIFNSLNNELILARDRMGEKPLYYYHHQQVFAFASELNVLAVNYDLTVRAEAMQEFLVKGWVGPATTIYQHVLSVPPAHYIQLTFNGTHPTNSSIHCWWSPRTEMEARNEMGAVPLSASEGKASVLSALETSVIRRMTTSDLPVGCFLSGGIDSGIITALAARHNQQLHTFTFNFEGLWDESELAAKVAMRYNTNHTNIKLDCAAIENEIGRILLPYGEPFCDDSAIPSYYVAKEAKKYVTVVLNGDGGDEVFGGYRRYVPALWPGWVQSGAKHLARALPLLPPPHHKMSYYNYLYRFLKMQQPGITNRYLAASTDLFWEKHFNLPQNFSTNWIDKIAGNKKLSALQKMRLYDFEGLLPEVLLRKIDIATMQHALESRTVFFAPEVLSASAMIADKNLLSSTATKTVLRSIANDLLPAEIATAPKRGFEPPLANLIDGPMKNIVSDYMLSNNGPASDLVGKEKLENILIKKIQLPSDKRAKLIYTAFTLNYWHCHRPQFQRNKSKNNEILQSMI